MKRRYWHKLKDSTVKGIFDKETTIGEVLKRYKQPDWCTYPNALQGLLGCGSLLSVNLRHKISEDYCKGCECFKRSDKDADKRI